MSIILPLVFVTSGTLSALLLHEDYLLFSGAIYGLATALCIPFITGRKFKLRGQVGLRLLWIVSSSLSFLVGFYTALFFYNTFGEYSNFMSFEVAGLLGALILLLGATIIIRLQGESINWYIGFLILLSGFVAPYVATIVDLPLDRIYSLCLIWQFLVTLSLVFLLKKPPCSRKAG